MDGGVLEVILAVGGSCACGDVGRVVDSGACGDAGSGSCGRDNGYGGCGGVGVVVVLMVVVLLVGVGISWHLTIRFRL